MSNSTNQSRLISHEALVQDINQIIEEKTQRILKEGDRPYITAQRQIELLQQLSEFGLGRFLLQNKGLNGYWTHFILTYPWQKDYKHKNELEKFILERSFTVLATQERFSIFLRENQKSVANGKILACIPCGLMGELLYLNFDGIDDIALVGIDYDAATLEDAKKLAHEKNLSKFVSFKQADAWSLNLQNEFDLISSNGLNLYEPDDDKVVALYKQFYDALKPNGKLVTSFLTPHPGLDDACEWDMSKINPQDLLLQKILFVDILEVKWQCFRSSAKTKAQLESAGFSDIHFIYDKTKMFPTVIAVKSF